jgi:undecaprenyl pyrophosphate phosphatase UppP
MKDRIKWILVGLGFTFGFQVIISLLFTGIAYSNKSSAADVVSDTAVAVAFGSAVGAFLIGGFVIGWLTEDLRVVDSLIVAVSTLVLTLLVYTALPSGNKGQFISGQLLNNISRGSLLAILALIAGAIGSYWGWHLKVPQEGVLDRIALVLGLVGVIVGPFVLLAVGGRDANNPNATSLPWYFLAIVLIVVLVIVGVGFVLFTRESHYEDEISISPEHHKEEGPSA